MKYTGGEGTLCSIFYHDGKSLSNSVQTPKEAHSEFGSVPKARWFSAGRLTASAVVSKGGKFACPFFKNIG